VDAVGASADSRANRANLGNTRSAGDRLLVLLLGKATRFVGFYTGRRKALHRRFSALAMAPNTFLTRDGPPAGPDARPVRERETLERLAAESSGLFETDAALSPPKIHGRAGSGRIGRVVVLGG